jgi:hypothetical protein
MAEEDLTTYTVSDPSSNLDVSSDTITVTTAARQENYYVVKDFGTDYFNGLNIDFRLHHLSTSSTGSLLGALGLSNTLNYQASWGETTSIFICTVETTESTREMRLYRGYDSAMDSISISANTTYYCTLSRSTSSDTVTVSIYTDSDRTSLFGTLEVSGFGTGTKYRYFYAAVSRYYNSGEFASGYIAHIEINGVSQLSKIYGVTVGDISKIGPVSLGYITKINGIEV